MSDNNDIKLVTRDNLEQAANSVIDLVLAKNADYGDAWRKFGVAGVMVRINDKGMRLETLSDGRKALVLDEAIMDTVKDICGYTLLAILELESGNAHVYSDKEATNK